MHRGEEESTNPCLVGSDRASPAWTESSHHTAARQASQGLRKTQPESVPMPSTMAYPSGCWICSSEEDPSSAITVFQGRSLIFSFDTM
jgi:hypothetical protein